MPSRFRPFFIALALSWTALLGAAIFYSKQYPESPWITKALLPALAAEVGFYLASLFLETRNALLVFRPERTRAAILWFSALAPYFIFSLGSGRFVSNAFYQLVALTGVFSFWHVFLPRRAAYDFGFLIIAAAPVVTRVFGRIYLSPDRHVRAEILGQLMWIRLGIAALLLLREWNPGAFSLWPSAPEWRLGLLYYAIAIVPLALLALGIHDARWAPIAGEWWRVAGIAVGTFFGFLWVTALSEEMFFRGVLTRALFDKFSSSAFAVIVSSVVYGAAHLWFHAFPDWRQASVAGLLGLVLGSAYLRSGSVRVSMVTHAAVITTWRLFFR